jgi:hypothetical protein
MHQPTTIDFSAVLRLKTLDAEDDLRRLIQAINDGRTARGMPGLTLRDIEVITAARRGEVSRILEEDNAN